MDDDASPVEHANRAGAGLECREPREHVVGQLIGRPRGAGTGNPQPDSLLVDNGARDAEHRSGIALSQPASARSQALARRWAAAASGCLDAHPPIIAGRDG